MQSRLRGIDWVMVLAILPIMVAGLVSMRSLTTTTNFFSHQLVWIGISFAVFFLASQVDFRFLKRSDILVRIFLVLASLLLLLFLVSKSVNGATSWFQLGGVAFQPVDMMKLAVIIILAKYFSRRHVEIAQWKHLFISGLYAFIPFMLVFLQPDFVSAMIIGVIWFGMLLVSGLGRKQLLIVLSIAAVLFAFLWVGVFKPYQKARILNFINPSADVRKTGYNALQSTIAVGSGQFVGKGVGYGTQSRLQFLPEHETDFIFAAFAEEWGFVGAVLLLLLYGIIFWRIYDTATKGETNFEVLFGVGVAIYLLTHIIINIGMNIGIMPVTGIPLPLMSYGGSHLVTEMLALGLLSSTRRYARATHRSSMTTMLVGGV